MPSGRWLGARLPTPWAICSLERRSLATGRIIHWVSAALIVSFIGKTSLCRDDVAGPVTGSQDGPDRDRRLRPFLARDRTGRCDAILPRPSACALVPSPKVGSSEEQLNSAGRKGDRALHGHDPGRA